MPTDNIYDALRESHEVQRALCMKLVRAAPHGDLRRELYQELKIELAAHAAAEERFLYAPILMDDMGLDSSRHAMSEHHKIDELVEELGKAKSLGGSWLAKAKKLSDEVRHHLQEEEKKFFQVSGKILSDAQKENLAGQYLEDYQRFKKLLAQQ
ncbi:TPA: hemerythrin domain-containing protein [Pseudomonas aeruginosa]|uniref:hemerythrin domain-containing protein n=1 Tax=Pseudomonas aeruginosa TaxID=287 RepID=UPI000F893434|nr:hemerythrin domain-containing protein [Pseudomonas aeruginosa]RUI04802.1 hemerythrin domain-containing protein [Pseudomonas aeruginosa]HBO3117524.1 hemerythrin domain-containing protein [Pseudomonas aeruginosa]